MTKEVKQYVEGCDQCQRMKNRAEMPAGKLRPNQVPERLWQHILVDFIMKLPMSKGHDPILVVCDRFSKMSHFVATIEKMMTEELVRLFRDNMWKLHGLPESVISDRRLQFAVGLMKELNKMLGIETKLSMAYHLQTDGQMESVVATTCQNGTRSLLTSAKLTEGYLVVGITRELNKEPSLHCYPIYISYRWFMLQQCVYLMSTPQ